MGSVPIHMPKLILISALVEALGVFLMIVTSEDFDGSWIFLLLGIIYFIIMYSRYRNSDARHTYETDTKREVTNLRQVDNYVQRLNGLTSSTIEGANNTNVHGSSVQSKLMDSFKKNIPGLDILNDLSTKNDSNDKESK